VPSEKTSFFICWLEPSYQLFVFFFKQKALIKKIFGLFVKTNQ